ncbi:putative sensor domain DACNV-containing protein [Pyxidicoccus sp. 3LFB2]
MSDKLKYPEHVALEFFEREDRRWDSDKSLMEILPWRHERPRAPTRSVLTRLVETMLFASMAMEEGRLQPVGIVFAEERAEFLKEVPWDIISIKSPNAFSVREVVKLAAICDFPRSFLVVMPDNEELKVFGVGTPTKRSLFSGDRLVRVMAPRPGTVVVARGETEVVRYERGSIPELPPMHMVGGSHQRQFNSIGRAVAGTTLLEAPKPDGFRDSFYGLHVSMQVYRVAAQMSRHGHGGILAVFGSEADAKLPAGTRELEVPLGFGVAIRDEMATTFQRLGGQNRDGPQPNVEERKLERMRQQLLGFSAVDGAVLLSHRMDVLGFGAKLPIPKEREVEVHTVTPQRSVGGPMDLKVRGTRHRAAATFADQNRDGMAVIVSQDGDAGVFQDLDGKVVYWPFLVKTEEIDF